MPIWDGRMKKHVVRNACRCEVISERFCSAVLPEGIWGMAGEYVASKPKDFAKDEWLSWGCAVNTPTLFDHRRAMSNRHLVISIEGMVAQLVTLISKGYRYYFVGRIAAGDDREVRDSRMLRYYDADLPKWTRERRRLRRLANFRYLRYEDWFIVLATEGEKERFLAEDGKRIRHVTKTPIPFKGYLIGYKQGGYQSVSAHERAKRNAMWTEYRECRERGEPGVKPPRPPRDSKWRVRVELDDDTYAGLEAYFLNIATHRQGDFIAREFITLPFQPYRPVREQLKKILTAVNAARKAAGFQRIPLSVVPFKRRIVKVFSPLGARGADDCYGGAEPTIERKSAGETISIAG